MQYKVLTLAFILLSVFVFAGERVNENIGKRSLYKIFTLEELVDMDVNNIDLTLENNGNNGTNDDPRRHGYYPNGTTRNFLFSGGIAATGYVDANGNGIIEYPEELRASWMASASLIREYQPGKWWVPGEEGTTRMSPDDPRAVFYVVNSSDGFGSDAYINWETAVELGADYQDLNGDGKYDPYVDRPDIIGDRVIWCVYNDGTDLSLRTPRLQTEPLGLEVHQQAWAFSRGDALGDVVFFRYKFINPTDHDINDLIFSIWADPDIGEATDDLIGCDTTLSLGYIYSNGNDNVYGVNPPAFGVDFFQGPVIETGVSSDTAFLFRGPVLGIDTLYGWINLPMTSFMYYINSDNIIGDPDQATIARNYQIGGLSADSTVIDPSIWGTGATANSNPKYFYSGDPVAGSGWIDDTPADKRFMVNTGPFQLAAGDTQVIVAAYVVAQGSSALNSIARLKEEDVAAQLAYNANFFVAGPPPPPEVEVRTGDKSIELIIDLEKNGTFDYDLTDSLGSRQVFEGIRIYQFRSQSISETVGELPNKQMIAQFDLDNEYEKIFLRQKNGEWKFLLDGESNLKPELFQDNGSAVLRYVIDTDAFTGSPLVNSREYFFTVTAFGINHGVIPGSSIPSIQRDSLGVITGDPSNWVTLSDADLLENSLTTNAVTVRPQSNEVSPYRNSDAEYTGSRLFHDGNVLVDVVRQEELTGHEYEVSFFDDGKMWSLRDVNTNSIPSVVSGTDTQYIDSMAFQAVVEEGEQAWNFPIVDGFSIQVYNTPSGLDTAIVDSLNANNISWLQGSRAYNTVLVEGRSPTVFDSSIAFIYNTNRANLSVGYVKDRFYPPIKLVFDTSDVSTAHHYRASWNLFSGVKPTFVSAYDVSDPDQPVKLNIAYLNPSPTGTIDFSTGNEIVVFRSEYDENGRYSGAAESDQLFKDESYIIGQLNLVADSLRQANRMEITVKPYYPNSDLDSYRFDTQSLFPELKASERRNLLDRVKIVPNPYFGYSSYETSYDTPILKFTHLDKEVTIRIFNLAGQLLKTLTERDKSSREANELRWDLRNEAGLKIASGMYIAHIEVPGVGSKIIKFAVVQREERIDRY